MKKIGSGFYYHVFDLGNGRVLKKVTGHLYRVRKLIQWGRTIHFTIIDIVNPLKMRSAFIKELITSKKVVREVGVELFGNPQFVNTFEYTQDLVVLTKQALLDTPLLSKQKDLIEQYIEGMYTLWRYGYADIVFNFLHNNGVSLQTGRLVFIDFNEFTADKDKVLRDIQKKKWETQYSLAFDFPDMPELKEYVLRRFAEAFTKENLETLWCSAKAPMDS